MLPGGVEDRGGEIGDRAEAAAFDEDRFLVQRVEWLDNFAVGGEDGGIGETLLDELEVISRCQCRGTPAR